MPEGRARNEAENEQRAGRKKVIPKRVTWKLEIRDQNPPCCLSPTVNATSVFGRSPAALTRHVRLSSNGDGRDQWETGRFRGSAWTQDHRSSGVTVLRSIPAVDTPRHNAGPARDKLFRSHHHNQLGFQSRPLFQLFASNPAAVALAEPHAATVLPPGAVQNRFDSRKEA